MEWTRSETLALSLHSCTKCDGLGTTLDRSGDLQPCKCTLRSIFRICLNHFRQCVEQDPFISRMSCEPSYAGHKRPTTWGRKDEEYICDFEMVARRALDDDEYRIFRFHFFLGADWKMCCRKLNVDRGSFFHDVYRIEEKLGRVFRELKPYPLYPLEEYFHRASCWPNSASEEWKKANPSPITPIIPIDRKPGLKFPRPVRKAA